MNIKPILSILPSITEIIGTLIQANDYDYIKYPLSEQAGMDSIYFFKKGNDIVIANLLNQDISICFPSINNYVGIEYIVCTKTNCIITSEFQHYTNKGGKYICISLELNNNHSQSGTNDETEKIVNFLGSLDTNIEGAVCMNKNVYVDFLPPYLVIEVPPPLSIKSISYLKIYGDGYVPIYAYQNIDMGQSTCNSYILEYENRIGSQYIHLEGSLICGNYNPQINSSYFYNTKENIEQFLQTGKCLNYE